ncbi:energy transducer TonB [Longimicrobium sp.]|uniref:energy transducer TonB n=1 Tax=Longimicrobium sp. TaxID=2029185 RepID=UPI002E380D7F|nr:energy transducer TonB [Longimicrobium sp.]HEX6038737.1 energy transducer TonB [Longimicrobium sp.]
MKRISAALVLLCSLAAPARAQEPAADSARVYELAEVEQRPRPANLGALRDALAANYPAEQLHARTAGTVLVSFVVEPDGTLRDPRVLTSTDPAFDAPTVAAVQGLRFEPARLADRAVPVRAQLNIQWQPPVSTEEQGTVARAGVTDEGERVYTMNQVVAQARVYEMREVEVMPRPLNMSSFRRALERAYPAHLRGSRTRGTVLVRMRVNTEGVVTVPHIVASTHPEFNQPTLENVVLLRFRPARVDGKPVNAWVELPIEWSISEPAQPETMRMP